MGCSYPYFDMYNNSEKQETKDFAFNQIMMTILHGYFYYQASIYRLGRNETLDDSYLALKHFKQKIIKELNKNTFDIINYVYSLPERYNNVKIGCFTGTNQFVETQSFRDFMLNL